MDLQVVGVLLLTGGIWTIYGGVSGFNPLDVLQQILRNPAQASSIVASSKTALPSSGGGDGVTVAGNPFSKFAVVRGFKAHKADGSKSPGIDYRMPVGTPVLTPVGGLLTNSPNAGDYGNLVTITTKDGYRLHFAHLSSFRRSNNIEVKAGDLIALSGGAKGAPGSGNSTGPHLHFDVLSPGGGYVDPVSFLAGKAAA